MARTLVTERASRDKDLRQEQIWENGRRRQSKGGQRTGHGAF